MKLYLNVSLPLYSFDIIQAALENKPLNLQNELKEAAIEYLYNLNDEDIFDCLDEDEDTANCLVDFNELKKKAELSIKNSNYEITDISESECLLNWYDVFLIVETI